MDFSIFCAAFTSAFESCLARSTADSKASRTLPGPACGDPARESPPNGCAGDVARSGSGAGPKGFGPAAFGAVLTTENVRLSASPILGFATSTAAPLTTEKLRLDAAPVAGLEVITAVPLNTVTFSPSVSHIAGFVLVIVNPFTTKKLRLSVSAVAELPRAAMNPFSTAKLKLSASPATVLTRAGVKPFNTAKLGLSASPGDRGITGRLPASSGSEPNTASITSENPSPSLSAFDLGSTTVKRLIGVITLEELPATLVATSASVPLMPAGIVTVAVAVADEPEGLMELTSTLIGGTEEG